MPTRSLQFEMFEDRITPIIGQTSVAPLADLTSTLNGVVKIHSTIGGGGTGTLLSTGRHILTAAHVVDEGLLPSQLSVEFTNGVNGSGINVARIFIHPQYSDSKNLNDIAILELAELAPAGIHRYDLYRQNNEIGQTVTLAGFGQIGTGDWKPRDSLSPNEVRWTDNKLHTGQNRFDATGTILQATILALSYSSKPLIGTLKISRDGFLSREIPANHTYLHIANAFGDVVGRENVSVRGAGTSSQPYVITLTGSAADYPISSFNTVSTYNSNVEFIYYSKGISHHNENILIADFDSGQSQHDSLGWAWNLPNTGVGQKESSTDSGDSGGPALISGKIAGVAAFKTYRQNLPTLFNKSLSTQETGSGIGDMFAHTRVSSFASWIDEITDDNHELNVNLFNQFPEITGNRILLKFDSVGAASTFSLYINELLAYSGNILEMSKIRIGGAAAPDTLTIEGKTTVPLEFYQFDPIEDTLVLRGELAGELASTNLPLVAINGSRINPGGREDVGLYDVGQLLMGGGTYEVNLNNIERIISRKVILTNPILLPRLEYVVPLGTRFKIIDNIGPDPVIGTFQGLQEGSALTINNQRFVITYKGNGYNDVVLTRADNPPSWDLGRNYYGRTWQLMAGQRYESDITATDPDGRVVDYSLNQPLGAGATYNHQSGVFVFEPLASQIGQKFTFVLTASDGTESISQNLSFEVTDSRPKMTTVTSNVTEIFDNGSTAVTVTASGVTTPIGQIDGVEFWRDLNRNGQVDEYTDQLLDRYGANNAGSYSWNGFLNGASVGDTVNVLVRARRYSFSDVFYSDLKTVSFRVVVAPPPDIRVQPIRGEQRSNTVTTGNQVGGHVIMDLQGNARVIWWDHHQQLAFMQLYDATGTAVGIPVWLRGVNGRITDADGQFYGDKFVVSYEHPTNNSTNRMIFNGDGSREVNVTYGFPNGQYRSDSSRVAMHPTENSWVAVMDRGGYFAEDIVMQRVTNLNLVGGSETSVASGDGGQRNAAIASLNHHGYVVAWLDINSRKLMAKLYNWNGEVFRDSFQLNTSTDYPNWPSSEDSLDLTYIPTSSGGGFAAVWHVNSGNILLRRFDILGNPLDPAEIIVNKDTPLGSQFYASPRVAFGGTNIDQSGAFPGFLAVTWTASGFDPGQGPNNSGVYAQIIKGTVPYYGDNLRVNTTIAGGQFFYPGVGGLGMDWTTGQFTIGWQGNGDGDADGIYAQRFSINQNEAPQTVPATVQAIQNRPVTVDLRTLSSDQYTPADDLIFQVTASQGGNAQLLSDGHTVLFTPGKATTPEAYFQFRVQDNGLDGLPTAFNTGQVDITILPEFIDEDGDRYTITSSGLGRFAVLLHDPDGNGKGPISLIDARGTSHTNSRINVTVRKSPTGDGIVTIGSIRGNGFHSLSAPASDLLSSGLEVDGSVRSLNLRDISANAILRDSGAASRPVGLQLRDVGDGTRIDLGPALGTVTARNVGTARFQAATLDGLTVSGNFRGDIQLSGAAKETSYSLGPVLIKGDLSDSEWNVNGRIQQIRVNGTAVDWSLTGNSSHATGSITLNSATRVQVNLPQTPISSFTVNTFTDSSWNARSIGTWNSTGEIAGSTIRLSQSLTTGRLNVLKDSQVLLSYQPVDLASPLMGGNFISQSRLGSLTVNQLRNSTIAAKTVGSILIKSLQNDTQPELFGVVADESIGSVRVLTPALTWNGKLGSDQGLNNFRIRLI